MDQESRIWRALKDERERVPPISRLFAQQTGREELYSLEAAGWYLDYSRHRVNDRVMRLLVELAEAAGLPAAIRDMYAGREVNPSEGRAALHIALRRPGGAADDPVAGQVRLAQDARRDMYRIAESLRSGDWRGGTGKRIRHLVHIGIGGSHLGQETVHEALGYLRTESPLQVHFISSLDGSQITDLLRLLEPAETVFNLVSKSFTTLEVMQNAGTARRWLLDGGLAEADLCRHLLAVTANRDAALKTGIEPRNLLPMWDWVGGRYSVWSAAGLPLAVGLGPQEFDALLAGAHAMDRHFESAPLHANMPVLLGILGVWYGNIWGAESHAVLPYDHGLRLLPFHLQQLEMESNGKSVTLDGTPVSGHTGPVIWGGVGTNGQHAFHQLLHQGTRLVPVDFICGARPHHRLEAHHDWLIANCFAQAEALMTGLGEEEVRRRLQAAGMSPEEAARAAPHRSLPGNRPSSLLMTEQLNPASVGALIALYEHRVFVQARLWHTNPFDQWGVELGKLLADDIHRLVEKGAEASGQNPATLKLISRYRRLAGKERNSNE